MCLCLYPLFFRSFIYEHRGTNNMESLVQLGKTLSQAVEMLKQLCGDNTKLRIHVFEWHKEGRKEGKDDFMSGRPSTSKVEVFVKRVMHVVYSDCLKDRMSSKHEKKKLFGRLSPKNRPVWKVTGLSVLSNLLFLAKRNIAILERLPYSLGLTPCDILFSLSLRVSVLKTQKRSRSS